MVRPVAPADQNHQLNDLALMRETYSSLDHQHHQYIDDNPLAVTRRWNSSKQALASPFERVRPLWELTHMEGNHHCHEKNNEDMMMVMTMTIIKRMNVRHTLFRYGWTSHNMPLFNNHYYRWPLKELGCENSYPMFLNKGCCRAMVGQVFHFDFRYFWRELSCNAITYTYNSIID